MGSRFEVRRGHCCQGYGARNQESRHENSGCNEGCERQNRRHQRNRGQEDWSRHQGRRGEDRRHDWTCRQEDGLGDQEGCQEDGSRHQEGRDQNRRRGQVKVYRGPARSTARQVVLLEEKRCPACGRADLSGGSRKPSTKLWRSSVITWRGSYAAAKTPRARKVCSRSSTSYYWRFRACPKKSSRLSKRSQPNSVWSTTRLRSLPTGWKTRGCSFVAVPLWTNV